MPGTLTLDTVSVLLVWTAISIYALAFIAYAVDLSRRGARAADAQDAVTRERELVAVAAAGRSADSATAGPAGSVAESPGREANTLLRDEERAAEAAFQARPSDRPRLVWARIGTSLTVLGAPLPHRRRRHPRHRRRPRALVEHVRVRPDRHDAHRRVYLVSLLRYDLRFLGAFITGLVVLLLGGAALAFYVEISPLMDPLKSVWLVIHVFVASLATAIFALAFGLSVLQLMQARRERKTAALADASSDAVASAKTGPRFLRTLPGSDALESIAYRFAIIGFIFWTFTLIAGSIWANDAWGRYWGFDTKEVWTFVIWVLYAGYIHARATRGWRGSRSAWLSIIGFTAVMFNFTIVNMFFKGLHAYSGLS